MINVLRAQFAIEYERYLTNRGWVHACMNGNLEAFPHRPVANRAATIGSHLYLPKDPPAATPMACDNEKPRYVVNIPMGFYPETANKRAVHQILRLFRDQAFGATKTQSRLEGNQRMFVVIGMNQIESIDSSVNAAFTDVVSKLTQVSNIVYRVFGFFWKPMWVSQEELFKLIYGKGDVHVLLRGLKKAPADRLVEEKKAIKRYRKVKEKLSKDFAAYFGVTWSLSLLPFPRRYSLENAYKLIKALSSEERKVADRVRATFEGGSTGINPAIASKIPYGQVRQVLLRSFSTRYAVKRYEEECAGAGSYLVMADGDLRALRLGTGILSRFDATVAAQPEYPSMLSHGYCVHVTEPPLLSAGIGMDMAVRAAMGPYAYFPEPFSAALARRPHQGNHLNKLTFASKGTRLESRNLYRNGIAEGVLKRDAVFVADGGVEMETPARMLTVSNSSPNPLTAARVKAKKSLEAMKGTRQTHAHSLKWAENYYAICDFSCASVSDARKYLSYLFKVYDPVTRMFSLPGRFTRSHFDFTMAAYNNPLSVELQNFRNTARAHLISLGMTPAQFATAEACAQASGLAVYNYLLQLTG